jgi:hypothetical protein
MATRLYKAGFDHAKELIDEGRYVRDERDAWSEDQPTAEQENEFIGRHGWDEYAKWHLGVDDTADERTKKRYSFPYGDFKRVHRCAILTIESRAGQYKRLDIEGAAAKLHEMFDGVKHEARR